MLSGALAFTLLSCDDDVDNDPPGGGGEAGTTTSSGGGNGGSGGSGGNGGGNGGSGGSGGEFIPTPADVHFDAHNAIPSGEQILFNLWASPLDQVKSMAPDGSNVVDIFSIYRVWSMGVSRAGDKLAISCGDPEQLEHYDLNLGDAIQHSWIYDMASQSIEVVAYGNLNDECHHFGPGDTELYVCRRYDFFFDGEYYLSNGYRIGRIALSDYSFEWLTPEVAQTHFLNPRVNAAGDTLLFARNVIQGSTQSRTIRTQSPIGAASDDELRADAYRPLLSPDGTRYLYADATQQSKLHSSTLQNTDETLVADIDGTSAVFSPDGSKVAYLVWDDQSTCSHVEVVAADGSEAASPTRIRDCSVTGEFITNLAWFVRP